MPELTVTERLQPSLLDRLIDDAPERRAEGREQWVLSTDRLRELVLRDMSWLLNTENFESSVDLDDFPEVQKSVLNYGVPTLSGTVLDSVNLKRLERQVADAMATFEPRVLPGSVKITARFTSSIMSSKSLFLEISGDLWAQPVPQRLILQTEFELDTATVNVKEKQR